MVSIAGFNFFFNVKTDSAELAEYAGRGASLRPLRPGFRCLHCRSGLPAVPFL